MSQQAAAFIRANTTPHTPPLTPELRLHRGAGSEALWRAVARWRCEELPEFPFWGFAWAGGQGLARYLLDNPVLVRGRRVLDFASGSGIVAIAAARAGAKQVWAADIDDLAQVAAQLNAALNGVVVGNWRGVDMEKPLPGFDLIVAGDVCYEHLMAHRALKWLRLCAAAGTDVLLADPGRAYAPKDGVKELARFTVPTPRDLEPSEQREVTIWRVT